MKEICELSPVVQADGVEPTSLVIKFDDVPTVSERRGSAAERRAAELRRDGR